MFTAHSANPFQMPVAKGCCTWMGSFPLATSLPGILFPYSAKRHNLIFCMESFYRHTKSGIKNIGLNISFAASVATCNIHIALEPVHRYGGWLGSAAACSARLGRAEGKSKRIQARRATA